MAAVSHERLPLHQSKTKQETIGPPEVIDNFSGCPLAVTKIEIHRGTRDA
jgi:hypothetical protein